ncbi:MAG: ABC transporter permease [Desulfobacteraceae bacterium]|jgi:ABC-type dipeptide/oligopeptide/nickel transport system permease subunit|nr:ABC transporter permease [Desulfobacteraceae bacterium]
MSSSRSIQNNRFVQKPNRKRVKKQPGLLFNYLQELGKSKKGLSGAMMLSFFILVAIFAPIMAPYSPAEQNVDSQFAAPVFMGEGSRAHLLGADNLGRDTLSRTVYGTRISLGVAFIVILTSISIGTLIGAVSGYFGGIADLIIMRICDFQLSFPFILLAIVFMAILGPGFWSMVFALSVALWVNYARLVRGETLKLRELEYVQAARAIGVSSFKIIRGHIIPNALPALIVLGTLDFAWVIIFEAALSFLGLGIQPPTPSWGVMLSEARNFIYESPWMTIFPGAALFITCVGFNLFGDWLRDTFDPKLFRL